MTSTAEDGDRHHRGEHEKAGTRALFQRSRKEARALARHLAVTPRTAGEAVRQWWNQVPDEPVYPPLFYRLNYLRAAEIAGRYVGQAQARREPRSWRVR